MVHTVRPAAYGIPEAGHRVVEGSRRSHMLKFVALAALLSLLIGRALIPASAEEATPAAKAQQAPPVDVAIELKEFTVKPTTTTLVARPN